MRGGWAAEGQPTPSQPPPPTSEAKLAVRIDPTCSRPADRVPRFDTLALGHKLSMPPTRGTPPVHEIVCWGRWEREREGFWVSLRSNRLDFDFLIFFPFLILLALELWDVWIGGGTGSGLRFSNLLLLRWCLIGMIWTRYLFFFFNFFPRTSIWFWWFVAVWLGVLQEQWCR